MLDTEQVPELQTQLAESVQEPVAETPRESDADRNFRALREKQERFERELAKKTAEAELYQRQAEEDRKAFRQLQEELLRKSSPPEPDEYDTLDGDSWVTKSALEKGVERKVSSQVEAALKRLEEARRKEEAERYAREMPNRLKAKYSDFDQVVTRDTVEAFNRERPELARALGMISDPEAQAIAAYENIRMFMPQAKAIREAEVKLEANSSKPRTLANTSPIAKTIDYSARMTREEKAQVYAEALRKAGLA